MEFDLARLLRLARRWGIWVVLLAVLGGVAGYGLSTTRPIEYSSTTTLLVDANPEFYGVDVNNGLQAQTTNLNYLLGTEPFRQQAAATIGLDPTTGPDQLAAAMTTVASVSVPTVSITITGTDPEQTTAWANGVAQAFLGFLDERAASLGAESGWTSVSIADPAIGPGMAVSPNRTMWALLGAILAGLLAVTVVLAIEHLRASSPGQRRPGALPVLAVLDAIRPRTPGGAPLADVDSGTDAARGVVQLRSAVQVMTATQGMRTLAISSLRPGEGKSTVAANLAVALAQGGDRVILIDANLDAPHLGEIFGGGARAGLSSLMADPAMDLADAVSGTSWPNLMFIPAGPRQDEGRMDRAAFRRVLAGVVPHADLVIYEAPALSGQNDRLRLAGMADGALLVVGGERTRIEALRAIANEKVSAGTNVVGVVIDRGVGQAHVPTPMIDPLQPFQPALTLVTRPTPDRPVPVRAGSNGTAHAGANGRAHANGNGNGSHSAESVNGLVRTARAVPIADPDAPDRPATAASNGSGNGSRNVSA